MRNGMTRTKKIRSRFSTLPLRLLSVAVALPLVLALLYLGGWFLCLGIICTICLAMPELIHIAKRSGSMPLVWASYVLCILFLLIAILPAYRHALLLFSAACACVSFAVLLTLRDESRQALIDWASTIAMSLYIGIPLSLLAVLRNDGLWWVLTVFAGTWVFDSAAFFVGVTLGRHQSAPRISPKKTWEGFIGGLIACTIVLSLFARILGIAWYDAGYLGITIALAATYGDLFESILKRRAHVKDSGRIMPGHGGLLDRIDSILCSTLVVFLFSLVFVK
jgi:phosphatidate cytidylyltransferase